MSDHEPSAVASAVPSGFACSARGCHALRTAHSTAQRVGAFTLAELLVSMAALVLLVLLFTQLLNSAATVTTLGNKRMDADGQAREILDRMAIDLSRMVKRTDVDYYLKASGTASDCGACGTQPGNDQAAFYSTVASYYPTVPAPPPSYADKSPVSLLSYRINSDSTSTSYNRMQRMGKGLAWNGFSPNWTPIVFLPQSIGGPQPAGGNWPPAASTTLDDSSYEIIGPQVFRFEYYYLLKNGQFSSTPWYTVSSVRGLQDVSAIIVDIAGIDPRSRVLVDNSALVSPPNDNITLLAGALTDYNGQAPGVLCANWRATIDASGLPSAAISGIRVHERFFYLNQ